MGSSSWTSSQRDTVSGGSQAVKTGWSSAISSLKSSAEAGLAKLSLTTSDMVKAVRESTIKMQEQYKSTSEPKQSPGEAGGEMCPQCRAQFLTVTDLIQHVETIHLRARKGASVSHCVVQPC